MDGDVVQCKQYGSLFLISEELLTIAESEMC